MSDSSFISSSLSGTKTKDDLIERAHKAREARELARRREQAAISIQSYLKAHNVRQKIKEEACRELDQLVKENSFPAKEETILFLRRLLFVCDSRKERNVLDSLIQFILSSAMLKHQTSSESKNELIERKSTTPDKSGPKYASLVEIIFADSKQLDDVWLSLMAKVLNLCIGYLMDCSSKILDSQHIDTYLQLINLLTSAKSLAGVLNNPSQSNMVEKFSADLFKITVLTNKNFINQLSNLICERLTRFRNDLKRSILSNYTQIILSLLEHGYTSCPDMAIKGDKNYASKVITLFLSCPGIVYNLEKHSSETLESLKEDSVFKTFVRLLIDSVDHRESSSTTTIYMLANLVHLASKNEKALIECTQPFLIILTKLLSSCQKNMLLSSSSYLHSNFKPLLASKGKKKNESINVSFHPILGWVSKETSSNVDKNVIKQQLSHLWGVKLSKILLNDLIETCKTIMQDQKAERGESFAARNRSSPESSLFKRVVERAALTVTKNCKNSSSSSSSGVQKLTSPEANRISASCRMYFTALRTLITLRQEILTELCLHEYLLHNLWVFIKSLGPNNGLKAFLEHLTVTSKTNAPEFDILNLFFQCASHVICVLDDSELYEKQRPFSLDDWSDICTFVNIFVYKMLNNNLVPLNNHEMDPLLCETHKLLTDLYRRDSRRKFTSQDHWLIKEIKLSSFLKDLEVPKPSAKAIITMLPHAIPHRERVLIFRRLVARDRALVNSSNSTLISIRRSRIVEDGYQQLGNLSSNELKGFIRVKFINDHGLDEAGIDQDGVFKEFLEDTIKKVFDPALNLFCSTSDQRLYPSPTSRLHENHLSLFNFVGKMLGKAVYEGIVVDVPFATFFLNRVLGQPQSPLYSPIDDLPSLDAELYKNLTYIKHYDGDISDLGLTFSIDQDFMGKIETYELEPGGKSIPVTRESRVRYIHSVANFRMKTQIEKQTEAFVAGFKMIINPEWLTIFSASEFQRLISGDNTPIDLQDLRRHTKYFGGFHNNHRVVCWLWDILEKDFTAQELRLFLKFVTSCSKPPLLGFANLEPPFTIRCVEVEDDQDSGDTFGSVIRGFLAIRRSDPVDRLPTSSTCFNLLKLPNYQRRSTLRDKLRYAISSNPGFELS